MVNAAARSNFDESTIVTGFDTAYRLRKSGSTRKPDERRKLAWRLSLDSIHHLFIRVLESRGKQIILNIEWGICEYAYPKTSSLRHESA